MEAIPASVALPSTDSEAVPIWSRGWVWGLCAIIAMLPVLLPPLPMMPDLFSHIGRYHIMLHGAESPWLPRYYDFHWQLIGNLGVDLLMLPLGALLPTETAARLAVALIPALTVAGLYAASRAVWGRPQAAALLALPLALPYTFVFGFVNYHLGLALALLGFAAWVRAADRPHRWLLGAAIAGGIWVAHLAAWAVLLVLATGWELGRARRNLVDRAMQGALAVLPLAWPALIGFIWHTEGNSLWMRKPLIAKTVWFLTLMRAEHRDLDIALAMAIIGLALVLLVRGLRVRGSVNAGLAIGAGLLFLCFMALPWQIMGSAYADTRLLPALLITALLAVSWPRAGGVLACIGLLLFGVRTVELTRGWQQRGADAEVELSVLAMVPKGARIATIAHPSGGRYWVPSGFDHLPSLAIVRRQAYTNTEWDFPGAQLMRPTYNRGYGYNDSTSVAMNDRGQSGGRRLATILAGLPRARFDYVWSFDAPLEQPWLREVAHGVHGRLYRIVAEPVIKKVKKARRRHRR